MEIISSSNVLLMTANVGSLFEDPTNMLQKWLDVVLDSIKLKEPDFLAVHFQEVGGKNFEESMQYVDHFVKALVASPVLEPYDKANIYLDEDFTSESSFTALGNIYFIHESIVDIQQWNFNKSTFIPVVGREVFSGSIENVPTKEKYKFPIEYFPDGRWSRKGFMRTRWCLNQVAFDLINIHLFHDVSNLISCEKNPSVYSEFRSRALSWTLAKISSDDLENIPFFIFGDFNFRLDTCSLIKELCSPICIVERIMNKKDELAKLIYRSDVFSDQNDSESNNKDTENAILLTVGKKNFDRHENHNDFYLNPNNWLRKFDVEMDMFKDVIFEYDFNFPPSYPFSEDVEDGTSYMPTRCPSWCDRIFPCHTSRDIIVTSNVGKLPEYDMVGRNVCMGDHKPIYLHLHLRAIPISNPDRPLTPSENSTDISNKHNSTSPTQPFVLSIPNSPPATPPSPRLLHNRQHRRSCISAINGLPVADDSNLENWNILDYAVFQHETELSLKFRFMHKHRVYSGGGDDQQRSLSGAMTFSNLAKDVVRAKGVILAFSSGVKRPRRMSETSSSSSNSSSLDVTKNPNDEIVSESIFDEISCTNIGHKNKPPINEEFKDTSVPPPIKKNFKDNSVPPPIIVESKDTSVPPPIIVESKYNSVSPPIKEEFRDTSVPPPIIVESKDNSVSPPIKEEFKDTSVPPPIIVESKYNSVSPPIKEEFKDTSVPPPIKEESKDTSLPSSTNKKPTSDNVTKNMEQPSCSAPGRQNKSSPRRRLANFRRMKQIPGGKQCCLIS